MNIAPAQNTSLCFQAVAENSNLGDSLVLFCKNWVIFFKACIIKERMSEFV